MLTQSQKIEKLVSPTAMRYGLGRWRERCDCRTLRFEKCGFMVFTIKNNLPSVKDALLIITSLIVERISKFCFGEFAAVHILRLHEVTVPGISFRKDLSIFRKIHIEIHRHIHRCIFRFRAKNRISIPKGCFIVSRAADKNCCGENGSKQNFLHSLSFN